MDAAQARQILDYCLSECSETETPWCEFKLNFHDGVEFGKDVSAMANTSRLLSRQHSYIVFGVDPDTHAPVGTSFRPETAKGKGNADLIPWLVSKLGGVAEFEFSEIPDYRPGVRMVLCCVGPAGSAPVLFENVAYARIGTSTRPLADDASVERRLWNVILDSAFESDMAMESADVETVEELIDLSGYMRVMEYPASGTSGAIEKLEQDGLVKFRDGRYDITNACAILFAKQLSSFQLRSKAPRVITYRGANRLHATKDAKGDKGYAVAFSELASYVKSQIPRNERIETVRTSSPDYPDVAIREFLANAMIHQDFRATGTEVLVEVFDDRLEISNPGTPLIDVDRFIDHPPKSRNEVIADFMRKAGHCERRGSGVDRAFEALQASKLPIPKIERHEDFTRITLYRFRNPSRLTNDEKSEAVYWHCAFLYALDNEPLTNELVCERFGIQEQNKADASRLLKLAKESGKIKPFDPNSNSRKFAKYIPYWAN